MQILDLCKKESGKIWNRKHNGDDNGLTKINLKYYLLYSLIIYHKYNNLLNKYISF